MFIIATILNKLSISQFLIGNSIMNREDLCDFSLHAVIKNQFQILNSPK